MYACNQQEETLLSAERGQPLGENQLESAGGGIYSPAGHYFADDNDHVRQFLNDSVITSTDTVVAVSQISFFDTTYYSIAIVKVDMSGSSPDRELFTVFRSSEYVTVSIDSSSIIITDNTPPIGSTPPDSPGINDLEWFKWHGCVNALSCDYVGGDCQMAIIKAGKHYHCGCREDFNESGSIIITVGPGCGLDHDGDGHPGYM